MKSHPSSTPQNAIVQNTTVPITWGPNVNVATSAFGDALQEAALNGGSFREVFIATGETVKADLEKSGYTVND